MQNLKPTHFSAVADHPSAVSDVVGRVVAIAPAPLLPGEKETDYAEVALRIVRAAKPRDAIEEFLVRDVVDLTWEILRLRRVKAGTLRASMVVGVRLVLGGLDGDYSEAEKLGKSWAVGNNSARNKVNVILNKAGLTIDEVAERLDRLLASAEARRNNALREIDRHRDALGGGVRRSIEEIEDAEFRDVETGEAAAGAKL
jgi:hypothetical protein